MSKSQPIKDPTDEETQAIRDSTDTVTVVRSTSGHNINLHLPHDEKEQTPMCAKIREHNAHSGMGEQTIRFKDREKACYPAGWAEWCSYCVKWWREKNAE